jgi:hypothetical protein
VGVGILDADGNLTPEARDSFTAQVVLLLTSGNSDGKGAKISSLLDIPFPPPSNIKLLDPDRLLTNPKDPFGDLFWFDPSPFAPLTFDTLRDPNGGYQKNIVDGLYKPLMKAMNLKGVAVSPPIVDYSGFMPPEIAVKIKLPDLPLIPPLLLTPPAFAAKFDIGLPEAIKLIADLGKIVPIPSVPDIPSPPIPEFDFIVFPQVFLSLLQLPFTVLPDLIVKLTAEAPKLLAPDPAGLFQLVLELLFLPLIEILKLAGLLAILPKLLVATFIIILQNLVCAMVPMTVSQIIGTGMVVKFLGQALGLA